MPIGRHWLNYGLCPPALIQGSLPSMKLFVLTAPTDPGCAAPEPILIFFFPATPFFFFMPRPLRPLWCYRWGFTLEDNIWCACGISWGFRGPSLLLS